MKHDKSRKQMDSDHLGVANPIRPEDLDRRVTRHGIYPSLPASRGVPWSTYVRSQRSQRVSSRSISSSTEALDSDQARQTTQRILQHTRSLPTNSPVPYVSTTDREYRSDSGLHERYTTRIPRVTGINRSSYRGYMTEHDDYTTLGSLTPTSSSIGMIVRPKTKSVRPKGSIESESSHPIIGESAAMFTDMTDTMLKVLDRRMAAVAQGRELENTLAENAYALDQKRQSIIGHSLSSHPSYMNTVPRTTSMGIPIAESTPVPQIGPILHRPIPTPRVRDILDPLAPEPARAKYLERQMRHMTSVLLPPSESQSLEEGSLSREIQEYCSSMNERHQYERETHYVMLNSMKEHKERQRQQGKRERDEVYRQMSRNLESVREVARNTFNRASTISVEGHRMALTKTDFRYIKEKMNKIDQRIDGLYQNWQAEYKEAMTSEQCEDIQRFYEPYVWKYETKYKMLYQMLKQAIDERKRASSPRVSASELTPSLVALEDASTLKGKEWNRGKPHLETPHMYSTRDRRLTPTAPTYEDMRIETSLSMTPEESLEGLSAAVGGTESEQVSQQPYTKANGLETTVAPTSSIETRPKVVSESRDQGELPGRTEVTREASREDTLAATQCFFHTAPERRSATEVPATTTMSVLQIDTPPVTFMPVETECPEPSSIRTTLPSGSSPRPTATATPRPRTLEQRMSEGQTGTQSQDDEDSEESDTLEPLVIEGLPDELGLEWRVLHPFDIPGVRNPTEDTPPTHKRLAENDTLVELIQTAEYLEDAPSWEQRRFYPLRYGDPYYRGCGRGHGRGRGRGRGWLSEDVTERDTGGGQGRLHSRGNGRNGQDRNGFPPTSRRDIRLEMPPELEPSRFSDWSSIASLPARTSPPGVPDVQPTQNQLNVPAAIGTRQERDEVGISKGVAIVPQMDVLREDQGIHIRPAVLNMDTRTQNNVLEPEEEIVDIIPPTPVRSARSSPHTEDVMTSAPQGSSTNDDCPRHSQLRSHTIEGMSSIHPVDSSITSGIR